jgi:hypothetical protein
MLPGFPKKVDAQKLARGHYRLLREDGYSINVRRGVSSWYQVGNMVRRKSLGMFIFDLEYGYTAHDQIKAKDEGLQCEVVSDGAGRN